MAELTSAERAALDGPGYVILHGILAVAELAAWQAAFDAALAHAGPAALADQGTRHLTAAQLAAPRAAPDWSELARRPRLLAGITHLLGARFEAPPPHGREPLPGFGQQGLHSDWRELRGEQAVVATAIVLLDDFTATNGATRVVPGSQRSRAAVGKALAQPAAHHPREQRIVAPAGAALLFDGHLWHSATRNESGARRRTLQRTCRRADGPY